jgi:hypothetical protein
MRFDILKGNHFAVVYGLIDTVLGYATLTVACAQGLRRRLAGSASPRCSARSGRRSAP